jgi:hypothetical protein
MIMCIKQFIHSFCLMHGIFPRHSGTVERTRHYLRNDDQGISLYFT